MATKEYKPMEPKPRKAIKFTDSLVEVVYICESCGTEIKRTIREKTGLKSHWDAASSSPGWVVGR
jgi:hypothetical protein